MPLATGQNPSASEIPGSVGVGRLGEVGSACDAWLEREVAIKVLPERMADDGENTDPAAGCRGEESRS